MKILFVRHGESVDDIEDRYGGWADYDLTEKGKIQINESAQKISELGERFEIIYSSPLKRAHQAAKIISHQLNLKVEILELLKERNLNGILTGMIRSEAKIKYPDQVRKHQNYEYVDGSETEEEMIERVRKAKEILLGMEYSSIIAVTHGLFIKTFFKEVMNVNISKVGDGAFVLIENENDSFKILKADGIEYQQT